VCAGAKGENITFFSEGNYADSNASPTDSIPLSLHHDLSDARPRERGLRAAATAAADGDAQGQATPPIGSPLADFNGDGILDIAYTSADEGDNVGSVTVEFGLGDGSFLGRVKYRLGSSVRETVAVGDFNRDGKLDLLFTHNNELRPLLGNGDGSFTPGAVTLFRSRRTPSAVIAGDFNLDGKPDVALANDPYGVSVLTGKGDGAFEGQADYVTGGNVWGVTAGDLNLDGRPDIVGVNEFGSTISLLYNQGGGTFAPRATDGADKPVGTPSGLSPDLAQPGRLQQRRQG
jgi:hypothetical protein